MAGRKEGDGTIEENATNNIKITDTVFTLHCSSSNSKTSGSLGEG